MLRSMRATLTLDDDVAARLSELRADRRISLRRLVNEALRRGLAQLEEPPPLPRRPAPTRSVRLGGALLPDVDDVSTTLALVEGDARL